MANTIGELVWKVKVDDSQAKKGISNSQKGFKGLSGSVAGLVKAVPIAAGVIAGAKGLQKITTAIVKAASAAEETRNKFTVVFRDIQKDAQKAANNLQKNFGLSGVAAQQLLSDTGDLLSGFGFTQQSALSLSKQVNELAVDLASFTNFSGGAAGASAALTKALLGERESIKSLGIAIQESDIKRLAAAKGITGELDRQTKATLTLELALKQSKNAIGDFARSEDSLANRTRVLQARFDDLKVSAGEQLLDATSSGASGITQLIEGFDEFISQSQIIKNIFTAYREYIEFFILPFEVAVKLFDAFTGGVDSAAKAGIGFSSVFQGIGKFYEFLNDQVDKALNLLTGFIKAIRSGIGALFDFDKAGQVLSGAFFYIREAIERVSGVITDFIGSGIQKVANVFTSVKDAITGAVGQFSILDVVMGNISTAFQIGIVIFNQVKTRIDLVVNSVVSLFNVIKKAAGLVADFFGVLTGKVSAKELKKSLDEVKGASLDLVKVVGESSVDIFKTLFDDISTFSDETKDRMNSMQAVYTGVIDKLIAKNKEYNDSLEETSGGTVGGTSSTGNATGDTGAGTPGGGTGGGLDIGMVTSYKDALNEAGEAWDSLTDYQKFETVSAGLYSIGEIALNLGSSIGDLQQALFSRSIANLDAERAKRLKNGEDAVKVEQDYQKKKAEIEYKANIASWSLQLAQAVIMGVTAPLNAFTSTLAIPIVGPVLAPIAASLAAVGAAVQVAAVAASKPKKPQFAVGAMDIPRDMDAVVHAGEMIIPKPFADEVRAGNMSVIGGSGGNGGGAEINIIMDSKVFAKAMVKNINNGVATIDLRRGVKA